jgi:two-component system response regulator FixJ
MMPPSGLVHLIDDDEGVRRALTYLLGASGLAVKVYESASAFLEKCEDFQSGCVVSDVRMPGIDGVELLRQLQQKRARMPVVIMTGHADVPLAVAAMKGGAVDFIEKPFPDDVLLAAIQSAFERDRNMGRPAAEVAQIQTRLGSLTVREKEVLDGLLAGFPNKTIAYDLGLSPRTVEVHRANVMTKMVASSLPELVRMVLAAGNS